MISIAINNLVSNAKMVVIGGGDTVSIQWLDDRPQPTEQEIATEISRLEAEYKATEYQRDRLSEYNRLNQMELISDDSINGTTTHRDAILAIKAKYPKPNMT